MRPLTSARQLLGEIGYRLSGWPRRILAAGFLALAVLSAVSGRQRVQPSELVDVVVTARDLPAGSTLTGLDVRVAQWTAATVPVAAVRSSARAVGAILAGAMTAGEPVTSARLRGPGLAAGLSNGLVAVTVALADPAGIQLLQAGDLVDLSVTSGAAQIDATTLTPARLLAHSVRVLAILAAPVGGPASAEIDQTRLVVAADAITALRIAGATGAPIVATLRAPP